jgi:hypothetical protein
MDPTSASAVTPRGMRSRSPQRITGSSVSVSTMASTMGSSTSRAK